MALSTCGKLTNTEGLELARHGTPAFPVAIYDDDLRSASVPWHWHEEFEAGTVTEGSAVIAIDSQEVRFEKGEGFFINTGVLHSAWRAGDACRLHSLVFHADLVGGNRYSVFWEKYLTPLLRNAKILRLSPSAPQAPDFVRAALEAIERAWRVCQEEPDGYEFHAREALSRLVLLLTANLPRPPRISASEQRNAERIKAMLLFIHEHFSEALDTGVIARSASVSESECLRCFHRVIGTTPIQYLRQYRLMRAERMLAATGASISEIAALCGFQDLSYFAKAFREKNAMTPSEYRERQAAR